MGELAAYNVLVRIEAINNNTIIDTPRPSSTIIGDIAPEQLVVDNAEFSNLSTRSDYTSTTTDISFLSRH
jgi:hypothetical protein